MAKSALSPWKKYSEQWKNLEEKFHGFMQTTILKPEMKWGTIIYTYKGKNVVGFNGFKNFASIWFYDGVLLSDPLKVLINASEGKTKALRQWRFYDEKSFRINQVKKYVNEAIALAEKGISIKPEKSPPPKPSGILKEFLQKDRVLREALEKLSSGKQKDYIEYIDTAKKEDTKLTRLVKIIPMIKKGMGLNDKYKKQ
jgi:uncharacterized protein YdeI (YjbR/CyaY-like superfamily)